MQDLTGVAVQAQQEADLVPGGVLRVRGGSGERPWISASALYGLPAVIRGRAATASVSRSSAVAAKGRRSEAAAVVVSGTSLASKATLSATAWKREEPRAWRAVEWARVPARVSWRSRRAPAFRRAHGEVAAFRCRGAGLAHGACRRRARPCRTRGPAARGHLDVGRERRRARQAVQGGQEAVQAGRAGVLQGQGAGEPGEFGAHRLGPVGVQQGAEGVEAAADAAGRAAQGPGRVEGVTGSGLAVLAQRAQELGGLRARIACQRVPRHRLGQRVRRFKVLLCHAGASGRL
ncbi:hypothetical protein SGLAM104S_07827 [Streptomyces glaucescens]